MIVMMVMMLIMMIKKRNIEKEKKKTGLAQPLDKSRGEVDCTPRTADDGCLCLILLAR
jgi:hypothetical protein